MKVLRVLAAFVMFTGSWGTFIYGLGWWTPLSWLGALITASVSLIEFVRARSRIKQWQTFEDLDLPEGFKQELRIKIAAKHDCHYFAIDSTPFCAVNPGRGCENCPDYDPR